MAGRAAATATATVGGAGSAFCVEAQRDAAVCVFIGGLIAGPGLAWGDGGGVARGDGDFVEFGADRGDAP